MLFVETIVVVLFFVVILIKHIDNAFCVFYISMYFSLIAYSLLKFLSKIKRQ